MQIGYSARHNCATLCEPGPDEGTVACPRLCPHNGWSVAYAGHQASRRGGAHETADGEG